MEFKVILRWVMCILFFFLIVLDNLRIQTVYIYAFIK